ncbi:MIP/aquaporin family protein [Dinghuibacter silviterrae]|uniref:Glycerol uptake facilitator protein n=1 Tax=Dinghuibacter silviterrae TaxID=1539049 RepID=A0A4R8DSX8_9BACT|nr:MIP/aquaporin family protein [Dinghuibacter silviterrae]TDX01189.1 glycerol uptake facilitator protein [Dinghuibacter silviterrae]
MNPFIAELIGTTVLIFLGDGVVANVLLKETKGNNGGLIAITTAWAMAVFTGVVIAGPYSGAHLNPAVSIGLAMAGKFSWSLVPTYIAAQFLGAMLGAFLVWVCYKDHFDRTPDPGLQRAVFCTSPAIANPWRNFFCEATATFVLLAAVFYITDARVLPGKTFYLSDIYLAAVKTLPGVEPPHIGLGSVGALPVSLVVWVIGLSLGGTTGYAINPARDLGPRIVHQLLPLKGKGDSDWGYAPIPVLGPLVGAALAALMFKAL